MRRMKMNFFGKNIEHLISFFKYLWERLFCILIILGIVLGISGLILKFSQINNPEKVENIESQQVLFLGISLDNFGTLITVLGLLATAIWSMYQYTKNKSLQQQEKGAEIAKLFSDELLNKCYLVGKVINSSQLGSLLKLKDTDMNNLQRFDRDELLEIYENEPQLFEKYNTILSSAKLQNTYLHLLEYRISNKSFHDIVYKSDEEINNSIEKIMSGKYNKDEIENLKQKNLLRIEFEKFYLTSHSKEELYNIYTRTYTDKEARDLFIQDNKDLPFKFISLISDVLNELEYICMYISSQSAGTDYIYQSLHQMFLRTIKMLAVTIANDNKNYTDKYYTNIIHVYKEWQSIRNNNIKREKKNKKKAFKYLDPKIKTAY